MERINVILIGLIVLMMILPTNSIVFSLDSIKQAEGKGTNQQSDSGVEWYKFYGGTGADTAYALIQTVDGGFALAGSTSSFGAGSNDMWLVKIDANGVAQWNQSFGGAYGEGVSSMIQTADGSFVLAGYAVSRVGNQDMLLVKLSARNHPEINMSGVVLFIVILGAITILYTRVKR